MELVVLHNSKSILKIISSLFSLCEQKSNPFQKFSLIKILNQVKAGLPEGSSINEFAMQKSTQILYCGEMSLMAYLDMRQYLPTNQKFGQESMLLHMQKDNLPVPVNTLKV